MLTPGNCRCQLLKCYYSGCGHKETYGKARCPSVRYGKGECEGRQKTKCEEDRGDCESCRDAGLEARNSTIWDVEQSLVSMGYQKNRSGEWVDEEGVVLMA